MSNSQIQELALGLAGLLDFQISQNADPYEPMIILQALYTLFPRDSAQITIIKQVDQLQEKWECVLDYIEIHILDGQTLEIQSLGEEEIVQIYLLLIQYAQHAIKQKEEEELLNKQHKKKKSKKEIKEKVSQEKDKKKSPQKSNSQNKKQKGKKKKKESQLQIKNSRKDKISKQSKQPQQSNQANQKEKLVKKNDQQPKQNKNNQSKSKSKSKSKEKIKQKSKSKPKSPQKRKPQYNARKNKIGGHQQRKEVVKKPSPKKPIVSDQPLQNQAIRQITTAMRQTKKKQTNKLLLKDPKSHEEVLKAKRKFDYYLNEFKRQGKSSSNNNKKQGKGILDQYFLKVIEKRQKNIQQTIINEQIKYLLQLRDKKIAFINKIHKLTQKLERQRVIQKEKQQKKIMEQQRIKTQLKIQQSNAVFDKNMELLKQNYKVMRQKNQLQTYDERVVCRQMEQCMKRKKLDELQQLKLLWQQQNLKLNNIMGDEQKIKNKLINIYRKNRP